MSFHHSSGDCFAHLSWRQCQGRTLATLAPACKCRCDMEVIMQKEIMIAGFGGQGVLFGGQVVAYAAMDTGKEVTWIPSYGPEMRGGTANCTVVIADEEIGSPLVRNPKALIAMNLPSMDKYEAAIRPGGVMILNASIANRAIQRSDIRPVLIPGNEIAEGLGDRR